MKFSAMGKKNNNTYGKKSSTKSDECRREKKSNEIFVNGKNKNNTYTTKEAKLNQTNVEYKKKSNEIFGKEKQQLQCKLKKIKLNKRKKN